MRGSLFFDLDGTLTDPREGIVACLRHALEGVGVSPPSDDELTRYIGPPLQASLSSLVGADRADAALRLYRERFGTVGMFENRPYEGIAQALAALRGAGWRLSVVTSKPTVYARPILEHFALSQYFATVHGSELSGERTDKRDLIAHVLRTDAVPAEQATMIGDRLHDIAGARANQVRSRGVLWGYGSREELMGAGAGGLYATIDELVSELTSTRPTPRS